MCMGFRERDKMSEDSVVGGAGPQTEYVKLRPFWGMLEGPWRILA